MPGTLSGCADTPVFSGFSYAINNANQYSILLHDIETSASVPESAELGLVGLGLIGLGVVRRRR
ncbi:MAG TPA: PEP-CTERM sorting domain-containing protein [Acetobacteraceae bacterium]|nr:PEP-CTERM sorting domain-containing protein [Acetobacteraceae bacterium]